MSRRTAKKLYDPEVWKTTLKKIESGERDGPSDLLRMLFQLAATMPGGMNADAEDSVMELAERLVLEKQSLAAPIKGNPEGYFLTALYRSIRRARERETWTDAQRKSVLQERRGSQPHANIDQVLGLMSESDRTLLKRRFLNGRTLRELAAQEGVSHTAIRRRLDRILRSLRKNSPDF